MTATLALDYWLAGSLENLFWFHLSTFLAFLLQLLLMAELFFRLLARSRPSPLNRPLAWFAAAFYGLHPVNAETVNYVIQRGDVYATLGVVAGLTLYVVWPRGRWLGLYLLPVVAGTLIKPSAVMFAPLLWVYLMLFEDRRLLAATRRTIPALLVCLALYALQNHFTGQHRFGGTSLARHLQSQPWIALHYVKSALLPTELSADSDWEALPTPWCTPALVGFLFVAGAGLWGARCVQTPPRWPMAYGIAWFFLALAPTSLVPLAEVTNDHRMFFPYVGLALFVAGGLREVLAGATPRQLRVAAGVGLAVLLACAAGTRVRNQVWHTEESLWLDVTQKSPRNGRGHMNYGLSRLRAGDPAGALRAYERALPLLSAYSPLQINLAAAKAQLGLPGVEQHFLRALELDELNADPHLYYARWLQSQGRLEESTRHLRAALERKPDHRDSLYSLLDVLYQAKDWPGLEALVPQVRARLSADPSAERFEVRLRAHRERRFPAEANPDVTEALELSYVLYEAQALAEAIKACEHALRLNPRSAPAYNNLAAFKEAQGDLEGAIAAARQAVELAPDFEMARTNLQKFLRQRNGGRN